jgi:hypothetical protein
MTIASTAVETSHDNAQAALKRAKALLSVWAPLVRVIARNQKLEVKLTAGPPKTDGKTVWLRVPIELAYNEHVRSECGKWDSEENGFSCPACNVELECTVHLFHEVAHVVAGTFSHEDPDEELIELFRTTYPERSSSFDLVAMSLKGTGIRRDHTNSLVQRVAQQLPDEWGFFAFNAVEDVFVNASIFEARPGLVEIFSASTERIFRDGVRSLDGTVTHWNEQHPFMQALIAWNLIASSMPKLASGYLNSDVVSKVFGNKILMDLAAGITDVRKVKDRWKVSMKILIELEKLGLGPSKPSSASGSRQEQQEPGEPGDEDGLDAEGGSGGAGESEDSDSDSQVSASGSSSDSSEDSEEADETGTGGAEWGDKPEENTDGGTKSTKASEGNSSGDVEGDDGKKGADDDDDEIGVKESDSDGPGLSSDEPSQYSESISDGTEGKPRTVKVDHDASPEVNSDEVELDFEKAIEAMKALTGHEGFGDPDEVEKEYNQSHADDEDKETELIEAALTFDGYLDGDPGNVKKLVTEGTHFQYTSSHRVQDLFGASGNPEPYRMPVEVRVASASQVRLAFAANRKTGIKRNLESGSRVDRRTLGSRIASGDPRLFSRRSIPKKMDWTILIGLDISGSTCSGALEIEKRIAMGLGDLFSEVGIPFSMHVHTATTASGYGVYNLVILPLKKENERWDSAKSKAASVVPAFENLDGHTLEVYRKMLERQRGKDKLLLYFTDGEMPAANGHEERIILERECALLKRKGIHTVGVGIGTDSPRKYGLDTIRVDGVQDIPALLAGIGQRLTS